MKIFGYLFVLFALVSLSAEQKKLDLPKHFPAELKGYLKWTLPGYSVPAAVARDGKLYLRKDTKLISLDGSTLQKQWEIELGEPGGAVSLGGDGRLYLSSSESGKVFCVDRSDGKKVWVKEFGSGNHSGTLSLMYIPGKSNLLVFCPSPKKDGPREPAYGINASNGELLWTNKERLKRPYPPAANNGNPTIGTDGTVYISNNWRYVWAFEGQTGKVKWEFNVGKSGFATYPVLGKDRTVLVGAWNGNLYAIDAMSGKKKWTSDLGSPVENFPVIGFDDTIYVGARNKKFFSLNGQTGAKKWEISLTGETRWRSSTICSSRQLLVPTDSGLYSIDSETGRKNWILTGEKEPEVRYRLSSDGTLYLGIDNTLYAVQTAFGPDPEALWPQIGYNGANTAFTGEKQRDPLCIPEKALAFDSDKIVVALKTDSLNEQSRKTWSKAKDGLLLWLDASDVDGDGKTDPVRDSYPLTTWVDKAGSDNHAKPFSEGEKGKVCFGLKADRPNLGIVQFDGNGSMVFPEIDRVRTLVCVVERGEKCPTHTTFIGNSKSSKTWGYHGNHRIRQYGLKSIYDGLQRRDGEPIKFNQGGSFLKQLQITVLVTKAQVTADWLGLRKDGSGNRYFIGNYAEIMIYDRPLEVPEILSLEKYLSDKWGIAIKHDGTGGVGRMPLDTATQTNYFGMVSANKLVKPKLVTGAVILAEVTQPVAVLNARNGKKLTASGIKIGEVIKEEHEIKVGKGGSAVLLFSNGTITTLGENTTLYISKFKQEEFSDKTKKSEVGMEPSFSNTLLELKRGDLVVDAKKLDKKSNLIVATPLGVAGIRGTRFRIMITENSDENLTQSIIVSEGAVYCKPAKESKEAGHEFDLNAGEKVSLSSDSSMNQLKALKATKAEKVEIETTENITTESRKSTKLFNDKSFTDALKKVNATPKLTPFQQLRQLRKSKR